MPTRIPVTLHQSVCFPNQQSYASRCNSKELRRTKHQLTISPELPIKPCSWSRRHQCQCAARWESNNLYAFEIQTARSTWTADVLLRVFLISRHMDTCRFFCSALPSRTAHLLPMIHIVHFNPAILVAYFILVLFLSFSYSDLPISLIHARQSRSALL